MNGEFGQRVKAALKDRRMSIRAASRLMNYDHAFLSRVLAGKQLPSIELAESLDRLLDAGGEVVALAARLLDGDGKSHTQPTVPTLDDFLPEGDPLSLLTVRSPRRVGVGEVTDLQKRVHGLRLADDVLAGGDLIGPALRELRSTVRLYRENTHTEEVGRALLVQIGELAQIAGWIASDAGRHEEAERIYRLGLSAAKQAGDHTLAGNLAGSLAYQMSNTGRTDEGLTLAQAALHDAGEDAPGKARALYWDRVAWAHTQAGGTENARAAMRALGEASEALAQGAGDEGSAPAYLYWVDAGELQVMESRVYTELHRPLRAVPLLRDVLSGYDATHTREMALYLSWLAIALADANEPEEAAAVAERVIRIAADVASERTAERVRVVLSRLQEYGDVPEVAALLADHAA
ncbi:helix-turn-helix domain-containing protein [Streptomyces phaeochromogenes]|uniref:helix-turn-helix domain-containing protein n=1 Tax=Streptomyces phaeochromogenes TaxID=1923 RepID=UPI00224D110A|nr:helix-turn-helix transcriptional regulator [Streptomyces phaeochromogenes]MCX5605888.1 helix-turn-helix domain-containing protein [Streptomyces phaeochromogenes]